MSPTEAIPLLIVVLLLASVGGGDVEEMTVTFGGDRALETVGDVHVVAGGTVTVPEGTTVDGDIYVTGGDARIAGAVDGDVTLLAGRLAVADGAAVSGTVRTVAGEARVADGAAVGSVSRVEPPEPSSSPARRVVGFLLQFVVLGVAGWRLSRRRPRLLANVGHSVVEHPLVSGVVGSLAAVTLLVLFVYMAFTLVLIPVSVLGLLAELLVVLYGQVVFGYLIGTRLPIERVEVATVAGAGALLLALELLGAVPYVGGLVQFGVAVVGFGAVANTYFGLRRFEPAALPGSDWR